MKTLRPTRGCEKGRVDCARSSQNEAEKDHNVVNLLLQVALLGGLVSGVERR